MSIAALPSGLQPEDYEMIEAAVMETARGRWFLLEYARRQRAAEIDRLVAALDRLERRAARNDAEVKARVLKTISPPEAERSVEFAGTPSLRARRDDLALAERLQDFAWTLRERGLDESVCGPLEAMARETLRDASRDASPREESEALNAPLNQEPSDPPSICRDDDARGEDFAPAAQKAVLPPMDPRLMVLLRLDQIPLAERLALFG